MPDTANDNINPFKDIFEETAKSILKKTSYQREPRIQPGKETDSLIESNAKLVSMLYNFCEHCRYK